MSGNKAHPFTYAMQHASGECWTLLYSGMRAQGSGTRSFLAWDAAETLCGGVFGDLSAATPGEWFGYAGYEMLHELEDVPQSTPSPLALPRQFWFRPRRRMEWTHAREGAKQPEPPPPPSVRTPPVVRLESNMSTARYLDIVCATLERIHAGDLYQANITRKFYGRFAGPPDSFALFRHLCAVSPSPYAAYLRMGDTAILSSSPEGFLQIQPDGRVLTRPIKGSASPEASWLASSEKDRAENLMIVDLMRNDLARSCLPESIRVEALCDVERFATIQQMISTVSGTRRGECGVLDVLCGCFPPGSMTGAPKVAAMRWCARQEAMQRGVYSGALGRIDTAAQCADLSVVIRTLIIRGDRFEFQVGGGIVADSQPEAELAETLLKARAICAVLGLTPESLRQL